MHRTNMQSLECEQALDVRAGEDIKVGSIDFNKGDYVQALVYEAQLAWRSLIITCKGMGQNPVISSHSPSAAWRKLCEYYQVDGVVEKRRLQHEFNALAMKPRDAPTKSIFQVDKNRSEQGRLGVDISEDVINKSSPHPIITASATSAGSRARFQGLPDPGGALQEGVTEAREISVRKGKC